MGNAYALKIKKINDNCMLKDVVFSTNKRVVEFVYFITKFNKYYVENFRKSGTINEFTLYNIYTRKEYNVVIERVEAGYFFEGFEYSVEIPPSLEKVLFVSHVKENGPGYLSGVRPKCTILMGNEYKYFTSLRDIEEEIKKRNANFIFYDYEENEIKKINFEEFRDKSNMELRMGIEIEVRNLNENSLDLGKKVNFSEFKTKADNPFVPDIKSVIDKENDSLNTVDYSNNINADFEKDIANDNSLNNNVEQEASKSNDKILINDLEKPEVPCVVKEEDLSVGGVISEFHEKKEISKTLKELENQLDEQSDIEKDKMKTQKFKRLEDTKNIELDTRISNGGAVSSLTIKIEDKFENQLEKIHIEKNTLPPINILNNQSEYIQDSLDPKIIDNIFNINSVDITNENDEKMLKLKTDQVEIIKDLEFKGEGNKIDPEMCIIISKNEHQINISEATSNICNKSNISNSLNTSYTNNSNHNEEINSKASPLILPKKESKNLKIKSLESIKLLKKCKEKYKKKLSIYEKIDSNYHFMMINKLPLSMIETANTTPDIKSETADNKKANPTIQRKKVLIKGYNLNKFKTFDHSLSQNGIANFKLLNIQDLHQNTKNVKFENSQNFI